MKNLEQYKFYRFIKVISTFFGGLSLFLASFFIGFGVYTLIFEGEVEEFFTDIFIGIVILILYKYAFPYLKKTLLYVIYGEQKHD
jgi:hypothetical protein